MSTTSIHQAKATQKQPTALAFALEKTRATDQPEKAMAIVTQKTIAASAAAIWKKITQTHTWKDWQSHLVVSVRNPAKELSAAGQKFEQLLNLGFPVGKTTSHEILGHIEPLRILAWWKEEKGLRSCHVWQLEDLGNGTVAVHNVEVFAGKGVGFMRAIFQSSWRKKFQLSLDKLAAAVEPSAFAVETKAPIYARAQVTINRTAEEVYALLANKSTWSKWNPDVTEIDVRHPEKELHTFTWKANGSRIKSEVVVAQHPYIYVWKGKTGPIAAIHAWQLLPQDDGSTLVITQESMRGPLATVFMSSLKLEKILQQTLGSLKSYLVK